jgi:hypothetical protein
LCPLPSDRFDPGAYLGLGPAKLRASDGFLADVHLLSHNSSRAVACSIARVLWAVDAAFLDRSILESSGGSFHAAHDEDTHPAYSRLDLGNADIREVPRSWQFDHPRYPEIVGSALHETDAYSGGA